MAHIPGIDDDARLRDMLRIFLGRAGHEVREAREGAEGLRADRERPADVVLCDLFMPGLEGLGTIRAPGREAVRTKIVVISGGGLNGRVDALPAALLLGAAGPLRKPFERHELLAAVDEALHGTCVPLRALQPATSRHRARTCSRLAVPVVPICCTVIDATRQPNAAASAVPRPAASAHTIPA